MEITVASCSICGVLFKYKKNLYAHLRKKHRFTQGNDPVLKKKVNFLCDICSETFTLRSSLQRHKSKVHRIHLDDSKKPQSRLICPCYGCDHNFKSYVLLRKHIKDLHKTDTVLEEKHFKSVTDFNWWKADMEQQTFSSYVLDSATIILQDGNRKQFFNCHRSYTYTPKGENKRLTKAMGTNRMGSACPSKIEATFRDSGVSVRYWKSHYGHACEVGHIFLDPQFKAEISAKLKDGVSMDHILDSYKDRGVQKNSFRRSLLEKKDLHNIIRDFNIQHSTKKHSDDAISVQLWVQEMMEQRDESPVLFYKGQGQGDDQVPSLKDTDFVLIIMTSYQSELLKTFGEDKICIDGTHGTNAYDIQLYTLLTVDEFASGVPVAFCFSNRCDEFIFQLFLENIKSKIGIISPQTFMTDDALAFYNAWLAVMGAVPNRLLCCWHVDRNWRQNLNKISVPERKVYVYKTLRVILHLAQISLKMV